jgi:hypothetical protein
MLDHCAGRGNVTQLETVESLTNRGRDIEGGVLTRAVRYHLENRILLNRHKTVVFTDQAVYWPPGPESAARTTAPAGI